MAEKPILFSAPMIRAILNGSKTMTRRVLKPQPDTSKIPPPFHAEHREGRRWVFMARADFPGYSYATADFKLPYAPGDQLWVREAFAIHEGGPIRDAAGGIMDSVETEIVYRATDPHGATRWKPGIFLPRTLSRITLRVTAVKVDRLQEISEDDAKAEGVGPLPSGRYYCGHDEDGEITAKSPVTAFAWLWNSIHGEGAWMANPWVAAYSFERVKP